MVRRFWGQSATTVLLGLLLVGCPGDIDDPYYPAYINVDQQLRIEFSDSIALIPVTGPTQVTETVAVGKLINKTDSKFAADVTDTLPHTRHMEGKVFPDGGKIKALGPTSGAETACMVLSECESTGFG